MKVRIPETRMPLPLFLLLLLLLLSVSETHGQTPDEVRDAATHVLTLRGYDAEGRVTAQGSGFYFGPGRIATNYHVIRGAGMVRAFGPEGDTIAVAPFAEAVDPRLDLAILPAPEGRSRGLRIETFFPTVGDRVWTYGSPKGLTGTMSDGIVSAVRERGGRTVLQISAPISPGSSGGPVLDAAGRVIGVTVSSVAGGQNLNFAVPGRELARLAARSPRRVVFPIGEVRRPQPAVSERPELPDRWRLISRTTSDAELFYDQRSLHGDEGRLRVWVYSFYPETLMAGKAAFDASKALFEFRCGAQQFRLNQYLLLRGERVIGSSGSVSDGRWSAVAPESVAERLMARVCETDGSGASGSEAEPETAETRNAPPATTGDG